MTHSQYHRRDTIKPVQSDISAVTKVDHPFPELWLHAIGRTADAGLLRKDLHASANGFDRATGCVFIFLSQEPMQTLHLSLIHI